MTTPTTLFWIFFVYGLAFFSMGMAILLEVGHISEPRLRFALRFLALFGLIHGSHEWMEMFHVVGYGPFQAMDPHALDALRVLVLAVSFILLAMFGAALLLPAASARRGSLVIVSAGVAVWALGLLILLPRYPEAFWHVADAWTRYSLAIPSALLACAGLVMQKRAFREAGMAEFGQDSMWAAIAFAWYGAIGQAFVNATPLPPSNVINNDLFIGLFGFPIQLVRAAAAVVVAVFVIRFLRSSEVETQRKIAVLQAGRLRDAQRREELCGELLRRVVEAQEAERRRVARELHDAMGQSLTAIGLGLRGASIAVTDNPAKAVGQIQQLESLVGHSLEELERMVADLRPSHLDDLGLPATLRWLAGELERRVKLEVAVIVDGEEVRLPAEMATALFRIAQEALNNVVKHAQTDRAIVAVSYATDSVCVSVRDEGRGFDLSTLEDRDHPAWGLLGMRERVTLLGGKLVVDAAPGEGTSVSATIPLLPEEVGHADPLAAGG